MVGNAGCERTVEVGKRPEGLEVEGDDVTIGPSIYEWSIYGDYLGAVSGTEYDSGGWRNHLRSLCPDLTRRLHTNRDGKTWNV